MPTFASQWLFPRLGHFKRTLPQVSLNFVRYQHAHDFATPHEFDAAIQYGYGNWPSANARYLIGKETRIVYSPNCATPWGRAKPAVSQSVLIEMLEPETKTGNTNLAKGAN